VKNNKRAAQIMQSPHFGSRRRRQLAGRAGRLCKVSQPSQPAGQAAAGGRQAAWPSLVPIALGPLDRKLNFYAGRQACCAPMLLLFFSLVSWTCFAFAN
jgi:hypothetical protein